MDMYVPEDLIVADQHYNTNRSQLHRRQKAEWKIGLSDHDVGVGTGTERLIPLISDALSGGYVRKSKARL